MAIQEALGNVMIKPIRELIVTQPLPSLDQPDGATLWRNFFKTMPNLSHWIAANEELKSKEFASHDELAIEVEPPVIKGIQINSKDYNCKIEKSSVTVKRSSTFNFEILFNRRWKKFDKMKLVFTKGDNQTEAIIEEFTLECVGSNLFNVTPAKDSTWFLNVSEADSHKIAFVVDIPINITTGTWLMVLSLQSPDSSHFHNFLLCSVEIV